MTPKVSIIVPIYNVEKYLDRCLNSIRNQTFEDLEIICVDDCSPDKSRKIVEKHANEDPRVTLICHDVNLGLGGARNTGIKACKADYIASFDSDDYVLPEMIEKLWEATNENGSDIVCCGIDKVDENGEVIFETSFSKKTVNNIKNSINIFNLFSPNFCNKLWKKSLFTNNNIFFPEHDYFEDMSTTPRLLAKSKKISFIEGSYYKYVIREQSITNSYSAKHVFDYFKGFELILAFLEDNKLEDRYRDDFSEYVNRGMRFHSHSVLETDLIGDDLSQYLRHMLMLKIGFMEYRDVLKSKDHTEVLELLQQDNILFLSQGVRFKEMLETKIAEKNFYIEELELRRIELKNAVTVASESEKFLLESRERNKELTQGISVSNMMLEESRSRNKELTNKISNSRKMLEESRARNKELSEMISLSNKLVQELQMVNDKLEQDLSNVLGPFQSIGALLTGLILSPFINIRQKEKLKNKPKNFFQDSKNSFTRKIGKFLKII